MNALAVANYMVDRSLSVDGAPPLTNMALQKILYFADGKYLAEHDEPLFDERIEAWKYGPVVPEVYHEFKRFGADPITAKVSTLEVADDLLGWRRVTPSIPVTASTAPTRDFLNRVYDEYGRRSAIDLMAESHRDGSPWARVYRPGVRGAEIPAELMREYFASAG